MNIDQYIKEMRGDTQAKGYVTFIAFFLGAIAIISLLLLISSKIAIQDCKYSLNTYGIDCSNLSEKILVQDVASITFIVSFILMGVMMGFSPFLPRNKIKIDDDLRKVYLGSYERHLKQIQEEKEEQIRLNNAKKGFKEVKNEKKQ